MHCAREEEGNERQGLETDIDRGVCIVRSMCGCCHVVVDRGRSMGSVLPWEVRVQGLGIEYIRYVAKSICFCTVLRLLSFDERPCFTVSTRIKCLFVLVFLASWPLCLFITR